MLRKPENKVDIYNITGMIELLEMHYKNSTIGMKMAMILCMGGNDFFTQNIHAITCKDNGTVHVW